MTSPEPLHTIDAYLVESIKGVELPGELETCPLSLGARRLILSECPVIVVDPNREQDSLSFLESEPLEHPAGVFLEQPTSIHNRSFVLRGNQTDTLWFDEFNNPYSAITLKGNNFSNPGVMRHPTAVDEYIAWGLQESKIISRVLRASEVLRSRGISTEYILGAAEPKNYVWPVLGGTALAYEYIGLGEYRNRITQGYWAGLEDGQRTVDKLADIRAKFDKMTFLVTMRAMDTQYRLSDMVGSTKARTEIFEHYNKFWGHGKDLNPEDVNDINCFLENYLSVHLADNLARLHPDLTHGFLHGGNITALGGIVDLDSIKGESLGLGDDAVTALDVAKDLLTAASELYDAHRTAFPLSRKRNFITKFARDYITFSKHAQGPDQAQKALGEIFVELDKLGSDDPLKDRHIETCINTLRSAYFESEFATSLTYAKDFDEFDLQLEAWIQQLDVLTPKLIKKLSNSMDDFAQFLLSEGSFDAQTNGLELVSDVITNPSKYESLGVLGEMVQTRMYKSLINNWYTAFNERFPELSSNITDSVKELFLDEHLKAVRQQIVQVSESVAVKFIMERADALRELLVTESPQSLIPYGESITSEGTRPRFRWLETGDIPLNELLEIVHEETDVEIVPVGAIARGKSFNIELQNADELQEVITDGCVDGYSPDVRSNSLIMSISKEYSGDAPVLYAAVVLKDATGKTNIQLYLRRSVMDDVMRKIGYSRQDSETLFSLV